MLLTLPHCQESDNDDRGGAGNDGAGRDRQECLLHRASIRARHGWACGGVTRARGQRCQWTRGMRDENSICVTSDNRRSI